MIIQARWNREALILRGLVWIRKLHFYGKAFIHLCRGIYSPLPIQPHWTGIYLLLAPGLQMILALPNHISSIGFRDGPLPLYVVLEARNLETGIHERLLQRQRACPLLIEHADDAEDDENPVHVVRDDRAVSRRVLPAENRIEDIPPVGRLRVAAVHVPNGLRDVVRARPTARFRDIASHLLREFVELDLPDALGEHACRNQVENACRGDQEELD